MSVERVLYRTKHRIGRGPSHFGGGYEATEVIGKYKVERYGDSKYEHFLVWNPNRPCIVMYIEKESNVAVMNTVEYDAKCTIDGKMIRGDGMIRFAIDMAKQAGATKMELQDEYTFFCEETRTKVKLGPFSFLRQGKTWYEKYFGFTPAPEFRDEYEEAKQRRKLLDINMLQSQPCTYFDRATTNALLRTVELDFYSIVWEKTL